MIIRQAHIEGFGRYCGERIEGLGAGITVFFGPNEAGKSTCMEFLRSTLAGWKARRRGESAAYRPLLPDVPHGGSLVVETKAGLRYTVLRRDGLFELRDARSDLVPENIFRDLLGGLDREAYVGLYGFCSGEFAILEHADGAAASGILAGASYGAGVRSPKQALAALEKKRGEVFTPRGTRPRLGGIGEELGKVRERMRSRLKEVGGYDSIRDAVARCEERLRELSGTLRQMSCERDLVRTQLQLWETWERLHAARERLGELAPALCTIAAMRGERGFSSEAGSLGFKEGVLVCERIGDASLSSILAPLPCTAREQLAQMEEMLAAERMGLRQAEEAVEDAEVVLGGVAPEDVRAVAERPLLESLVRREAAYVDARSSLPGLEAVVKAGAADLAGYLSSRLGPGWDCERIRALDLSLFTRRAVEAAGVALTQAVEASDACVRILDEREQALQEANQTVERLERRISVMGPEPIVPDSASRKAVEEALRVLSERRGDVPLLEAEVRRTFDEACREMVGLVRDSSVEKPSARGEMSAGMGKDASKDEVSLDETAMGKEPFMEGDASAGSGMSVAGEGPVDKESSLDSGNPQRERLAACLETLDTARLHAGETEVLSRAIAEARLHAEEALRDARVAREALNEAKESEERLREELEDLAPTPRRERLSYLRGLLSRARRLAEALANDRRLLRDLGCVAFPETRPEDIGKEGVSDCDKAGPEMAARKESSQSERSQEEAGDGLYGLRFPPSSPRGIRRGSRLRLAAGIFLLVTGLAGMAFGLLCRPPLDSLLPPTPLAAVVVPMLSFFWEYVGAGLVPLGIGLCVLSLVLFLSARPESDPGMLAEEERRLRDRHAAAESWHEHVEGLSSVLKELNSVVVSSSAIGEENLDAVERLCERQENRCAARERKEDALEEAVRRSAVQKRTAEAAARRAEVAKDLFSESRRRWASFLAERGFDARLAGKDVDALHARCSAAALACRTALEAMRRRDEALAALREAGNVLAGSPDVERVMGSELGEKDFRRDFGFSGNGMSSLEAAARTMLDGVRAAEETLGVRRRIEAEIEAAGNVRTYAERRRDAAADACRDASDRLREAQMAWGGWMERLGMDAATPPALAVEAFGVMDHALAMEDALSGRKAELEERRRKLDAFEQEVAQAFRRMGGPAMEDAPGEEEKTGVSEELSRPSLGETDWLALHAALLERARTACRENERRRECEEAVSAARLRRDRLSSSCRNWETERTRLLEETGTYARESFLAVCDALDAHRQADEALRVIAEAAAAVPGEVSTERFLEGFAPGRRQALEERLATIEREQERLEAERGRLGVEMGRLGGEARALETDEELPAQRLREESLAEQARSLAVEWLAATVASAALAHSMEDYARDRQPDVLRKASVLFQRMTAGAWRGIVTDYEGGLSMESADGRAMTPALLSTGTREQAFLSLRLATAMVREAFSEPLPFLMDDVLVGFDAERERLAIATLAEAFAEGGRQLLLFTCHEATALLVHEVDPAASLYRIEAGHVRRGGWEEIVRVD